MSCMLLLSEVIAELIALNVLDIHSDISELWSCEVRDIFFFYTVYNFYSLYADGFYERYKAYLGT